VQEPTVRCRFCGEEILAVAIKCKHCKSDLTESAASPASEPSAQAVDYGVVLLAIPAIAVALMWLWIANLNLLQTPGAWLWLVTIVAIAATAIIATLEDGRARGSVDAKWAATIALVWLIGYPAYMGHREKHGLKNLRIPGIVVALLFVGSLVFIQRTIAVAERAANLVEVELVQSLAPPESPADGALTGSEFGDGEVESTPVEPVLEQSPVIPQPGLYAASADQLLTIGAGDESAVEVTLTLGAGGSAACEEGDVSCLSVSGVASRDGADYVVRAAAECSFHLISSGSGLVVSAPTGNCGSGTGNRHQLSAFAGTYAPLCRVEGSGEWRPCDDNAAQP